MMTDEELKDLIYGADPVSTEVARTFAKREAESAIKRCLLSGEFSPYWNEGSGDSASAGAISIRVGGPYPCWGAVSYRGEELVRLHHRELADLKHVVGRAMIIAKSKLGEKHGSEV